MRCALVGSHYYTRVPLTPEDEIYVEHDAQNAYDPHAHKVFAKLNGEWVHVGFIDIAHAAALARRCIKHARIVTQGNGSEIPLQVTCE